MSAAMAMREEPPPEYRPPALPDAAFLAMHERLVLWGRIMLNGVAGRIAPSDSVTMPFGPRTSGSAIGGQPNGDEQRAAERLHIAVVSLPEVRQRIVLQVFYKAYEASVWYDEREGLTDVEQSAIEADMCREALYRLHQYDWANRHEGIVLILRQTEFRMVRIAAVRELVRIGA